MTIQEKIQEGTYLIINNHTRGKLSPTERKKLRDALLRYEDSQGVVVKVDRELPVNPYRRVKGGYDYEEQPYEADAYDKAKKDMADYVAVVSLTEGIGDEG